MEDNKIRGYKMKDSSVSQFLMCLLISLPIQQFISCFYTIPDQYDFFAYSYGNQTDDSNKDVNDVEAPNSAKLLVNESTD